MGDRKHGEKNNESKAVQPKREEEQQPEKKPAQALSRLSANVAQPADINTLQQTVGNRVVRRLITENSHPGVLQRHIPPSANEGFTKGFSGFRGFHEESIGQLKASHDANVKSHNKMVPHFNAVLEAAYEAKDHEKEGGGGAQSSQSGGESQAPQGREDIYEGD